MKRLIYVIVTCILFSIFVHAKRIPRMLELYPNYFATAPTYDADSFTLDKFYGDSVYKSITFSCHCKRRHPLGFIQFNIPYRLYKTGLHS